MTVRFLSPDINFFCSCLNIDSKLLASSEGVIFDLLVADAFKVAALLLVGYRERKRSDLLGKEFGTGHTVGHPH